MSAVRQAFAFLEANHEGGYESLVDEVYCRGGVLVETPEFFLAFVVQERVAEVIFACGNLRRLLGWAHANRDFFVFDAVEWTREICGKHTQKHRYSMNSLRR